MLEPVSLKRVLEALLANSDRYRKILYSPAIKLIRKTSGRDARNTVKALYTAGYIKPITTVRARLGYIVTKKGMDFVGWGSVETADPITLHKVAQDAFADKGCRVVPIPVRIIAPEELDMAAVVKAVSPEVWKMVVDKLSLLDRLTELEQQLNKLKEEVRK
jgi:hypothetical protein